MFSLAQAHLALNADGTIKDAQLQQRFEGNVANFMNLVEATLRHTPRHQWRVPGLAHR
jgi:hypothetical protein